MNKNRFFAISIVAAVLILLLPGCGLFSPSLDISRNQSNQNSNDDGGSLGLTDGEPYIGFSNDEINSPPQNSLAPQYSGSTAAEEDRAAEGIQTDAGEVQASPPVYATAVPDFEYNPPNDEPYEDMFFEDYGVNPFIDTEDDNQSTFAADVDTGSYTLARSYLNEGFLPPEDAIRVEEFVNYFPQGYPNPSARDTFGIYIDGAPTPFTENDRYQVIRVGVQGYDIPESDRRDAKLTFVIDVSGSMGNGDRLGIVQDALALLVAELRSSDTVAIVAYTDTAWVVLEPTSARHGEEIIDAINSLYPMASTNAEAGLIQGYRLAEAAFEESAINRVILCSDGVANVGNTGPDSIWESIEEYADAGITLTAVGVGMGNYNDVLLEQLADMGDGFYAYVDTHEEAERLFRHELVSTLQVIALDAKIQVEFNPEVVTRYRLIGFENRAVADEDFRDNTVDAAEIGAGHSVTALYEIKLETGAKGEIATVHLRWEGPDSERVREISETFYTRDLEDSFYRTDPYFQMDVLIAEFAEILRNSYWAQDGSLDQVYNYALELSDKLELAEFYEFLDLVGQAADRS
jgi:Ca-activated chloride channel family protein